MTFMTVTDVDIDTLADLVEADDMQAFEDELRDVPGDVLPASDEHDDCRECDDQRLDEHVQFHRHSGLPGGLVTGLEIGDGQGTAHAR
jgi:hypothetical protein